MKIKLFKTELADKNCGLVEGMIVEAQPVDYMKVVRDALGEGFDLMEPALREDVIEMAKKHTPEGLVVFVAPVMERS
ncbi:hypothetical protein N5V81_22235 [Escherichia coli]|nr:hypothetical protein [Escherichia coli]